MNLFKYFKRYVGEIGHVVVGRITAVDTNRWRVDINSTLDAMLPLSSVNLPGGELVNIIIIIFLLIMIFKKVFSNFSVVDLKKTNA